MLGVTAAALTAWQQAIVAAVFELCLVGVMVIYELLGQTAPQVEGQGKAQASDNVAEPAPPVSNEPQRLPSPAKAGPTGSVKSFVREQVAPAGGQRVDMKALAGDYRSWCAQKGFVPLDLERFLDDIEKLFAKLGIEIAVEGDQRVYCLGIKVEPTYAVAVTAVH
jgi:hypothetical protein